MSYGLGIARFGEPSPWIEQVPAFCHVPYVVLLTYFEKRTGKTKNDKFQGIKTSTPWEHQGAAAARILLRDLWLFRLFGSKWPFAGVGVARFLQALVFADGPCQAFGMVSASV